VIQHFQVSTKALIVRDDTMAVVKSWPSGNWDLIGGRIDTTDPTPLTTLAREIGEELPGATDVEIGDLLGVARISEIVFPDSSELLMVLYSVSAVIGDRLSAEHSELRWVTSTQAQTREMGALVAAAAQIWEETLESVQQ